MATFNIICNETGEIKDSYKVKGAAQRRANYLNKSAKVDFDLGRQPLRTFNVDEVSEWLPCEIDPTAEKKDAALFA